MSKRVPGIPSIDLAVQKEIRDVISPIKEIIEIREGIRKGANAYLRRNVNLGMLIKLGLITEEQARSVANDE